MGKGKITHVTETLTEWPADCTDDDEEAEIFHAKAKVIPLPFESIIKKQKTSHGDCAGCVYNMGRSREKNAVMEEIMQIVNDNSDLHDDALHKLIHKVHYDKIVVPEINKGNMQVMHFPLEMVAEHFREHDITPKRDMKRSLLRLIHIEEDLLNHITKSENGRIVYDKIHFKMYMDVLSKKKEYYSK